MPLISVALSPPSIGGLYRDDRSETVHLGKRRVSLLVAALCLLLALGRARHFHDLLAHGAGDHAVGVAILENVLLLGVYAFIAVAAMMSTVLGFPRLVVTPRGLTRRSLFRTTAAEWNSLSRFHVERLDGGRIMAATADIIGPNASPRLRRRKDRLFKIANTYRTPVETIVAGIHDYQTEALGVPAPLPRAVGAPVVPQYGIAGFRMPWATLGLLAVLTAVFVAEHRLGVAPEPTPLTANVLTLYGFGGANRGAVLHHGEVLRLLSSALLHLSAAHLIGNAVGLLLVGWPVERLVGRSWFLAILVAGSLAGSVAGLAAYPAHVTLAGASGGITGLFAAMAVLIFRLPAGRKRVFMLVRTTLVALVVFLPAGTQADFKIGHAAHIGGALAGAALGILLLRTWRASCRLPEFRKAGLAVGTAGLGLALLGIPTSLRLSREFVVSIEGCASADPDRTIRSCTAALDSGAGDTTIVLLSRGRAYAAKGQYDLAIADFDRLIALVPNSADAHLGRGYAFLRKGKLNQSVADFTKSIELNPKFTAAYFDRGAAYLDMGRNDLAIADEDQALALDPNQAGAYVVRGLAYSRKGGSNEAIADYSKAIVLKPGVPNAYSYRASAFLRQNRFDEAVADTTKALELQPESAAAHNDRAWALHLKGENALALPYAEKAVALGPGSAPAVETRAEIYEKLGRTRDAIADYRAVLAIDDHQQLARDGLKRLRADLVKTR